MSFGTKERYGEQREYGDDADVADVVNVLVWQLETEFHGEPDDEHTEIAISYDNCFLTVTVSGIAIFDKLEAGQSTLYQLVRSREHAIELLENAARGQIDAVLRGDWVTDVEFLPRSGHCFRESPATSLQPDENSTAVADGVSDEEQLRLHAVTAQKFAQRLLSARDAAIDKVSLSDPDFASLLKSSQVFAGFEGSRLKFTVLQVPETAECEEHTLMFDWIRMYSLTDRELVAEVIDFVRARTGAEEFTVNDENETEDDDEGDT